MRRELVAGSLSYVPVLGLGAILTGRHRFYARREGQPERLDGEARFAVVWQDVSGKLFMRRVLSYAHGPAVDQTAPVSIEMPLATSRRYVGHYASPMSTPIALMDCNNYYVSCERGLDASLVGVPVIVLSNNGACAIARSAEAKALGIYMGEARRRHGVTVTYAKAGIMLDDLLFEDKRPRTLFE